MCCPMFITISTIAFGAARAKSHAPLGRKIFPQSNFARPEPGRLTAQPRVDANGTIPATIDAPGFVRPRCQFFDS